MTNAVTDPGLDDFSGRMGRYFVAEIGEHRVELVLDATEALHGSPRARGGFQLEFLGPLDARFGQGVFPLAIDEDRFEIFLVPIAQEGNAIRYQAVFF